MEITAKDKFIADYQANKEILFADMPDSVRLMKEEAFEMFAAKGFPIKKDEDWRFTDLSKVLDPAFNHELGKKHADFDLSEVFKCDVPELNTTVLTTLNGVHVSKDSAITVYPNGVIVGGLKEAMKSHPEIVLSHYGKYSANNKDGITSINTALASDGVFIYVPKNVKVDKPIQIINLVNSIEDIFVETRNLFVLEQGSQASIIVCDHSLYFNKSFDNSITETYLGANAELDFYRVQNSSNNTYAVTSLFIDQERDSRFMSNIIVLHGGFIRNNIHSRLNGEGCECKLYGLSLTDREQHVDHHTLVEHLSPNCMSDEKYKCILDDQATGVFSGKVLVHKDAQKTQAFQSNNNILLTDAAKINSKPQLEIYADDVKCSHGATTGQLDADAMFYLMARGINPEEARMMLMYAFASDIINKIKVDALRERMDDLISKRLKGELSRCNNCTIKCG